MATPSSDVIGAIDEIARLPGSRAQHSRFRSRELWREWLAAYPTLFDADDERLAATQAALGYHYWEWAAAIVLFRTTGWLSLVEQYEFANHDRKRQVLTRLGIVERLDARPAECRVAQLPDLLVYAPDFSDWYFCEVKGPGDEVSEAQRGVFEALARYTARRVALVRFEWRGGENR